MPCTVPTAPTISITDDGDEDNITVTVSGSDAGTDNVFYWQDVGSTTVTAGGSRTGDGTISVSVGSAGCRYGYVLSNNQPAIDPCVAVSNVVEFLIVAVGGTVTGCECDIAGDALVSYTIERATETRSATGAAIPSWASVGTISLWLQPIGSGLQIEYEKRGLSVTHKAFACADPAPEEGDRVTAGGRTLLVQGVIDQAGLARVYRIDLDELL